MVDKKVIDTVRKKFKILFPAMDERMKRLWAASEAKIMGWGGITAVSEATELSPTTIRCGLKELEESSSLDKGRIRSIGGGRKKLIENAPNLVKALEKLVEPTTRGDPESPLRWTCKSTRNLAKTLSNQGYKVSHQTVASCLYDIGYSLQANRKTTEGKSHPDRDAQFKYISKKVKHFQKRKQPVISVDTKKKELIGQYKNNGHSFHPKKSPVKVNVHDFPNKELGKAIPYGVYDITNNEGWVNVGIDHDTAAFACESIKQWWLRMGSLVYPKTKKLLITADAGGSNGYRVRLWKLCLQELANTTGLCISVCHFPPGTSKWNKIEHRMFCHISENWRGKPLSSLAVVINLISNTKTDKGLHIKTSLDTNDYEIGIQVNDEEFDSIRLKKDKFHGEWNYTILPQS